MSVKGLFSKVLNLLLKIISKSENTKKIGLTSQIQSTPNGMFPAENHYFSSSIAVCVWQKCVKNTSHFASLVGMTRLELATTRPPDAYANQLRHIPISGAKLLFFLIKATCFYEKTYKRCENIHFFDGIVGLFHGNSLIS